MITFNMLRIALVLAVSLMMGGCNLIVQKSGVEIMSYPPAKVFIDEKEAGMTPYKNSGLKPGITEIKLVAQDRTWQRKVELQNNINTVIDWEFGNLEEMSGGYVLYLEKTGDQSRAGLLVSATPQKTAVAIDGEIRGFAPMKLDDVGEGDRQVTISFPGYKTVNVFVKAIRGYQLVIEARLAKEEVVVPVDNQTSGVGASLPMTVEQKDTVVIKETETGWLRVRSQAGAEGEEVGRVKPNESYELLEEQNGWYKILINEELSGWISSKYADKLE